MSPAARTSMFPPEGHSFYVHFVGMSPKKQSGHTVWCIHSLIVTSGDVLLNWYSEGYQSQDGQAAQYQAIWPPLQAGELSPHPLERGSDRPMGGYGRR